MRRSKIEIYLHLVWATKGREPLITPEWERAIYRCLTCEAQQMRCYVLAIGGMPDHVHMVVKYGVAFTVPELLKRLKGVSSALANDMNQHKTLFRWQKATRR